jgi:hypothetical protein
METGGGFSLRIKDPPEDDGKHRNGHPIFTAKSFEVESNVKQVAHAAGTVLFLAHQYHHAHAKNIPLHPAPPPSPPPHNTTVPFMNKEGRPQLQPPDDLFPGAANTDA